jgi:peptidoglycan/xylan/chitin deacetylase (PgdA/CDA1 family)
MRARAFLFVVAASWALLAEPAGAVRENRPCPAASILVYHRFGPAVADAMTVRTTTFRSQLGYLRQTGHPVITLRALVECLAGGAPTPADAVVITADDGHRSVFTDMRPVVAEFGVPVTLFIYPSAISNASYAMTWEQLSSLHQHGRFDIQSHTYWHPNFNIERRRLGPEAFRTFAATQLGKARTVIRNRMGVDPDLVAWPFGIYDEELGSMAREAGYKAGFTLQRRVVTSRDTMMALPRFLVTDDATGARFASMLPRREP